MSLFLPIITFILIGLALFSVLVFAVKCFPTKEIAIVLLAIFAESIVFAIYTLINFHGAFGPGIFLFLVSPIMTIIILVGLLVADRRLLPKLDKQRRTFYLVGAVLLISAQLSPVVGINGIGSYCDSRTRKLGDNIVMAIQAYKTNTGSYPTRIEALARDYGWKGETSYNCMKGLGINADDITVHFRIQKCQDHLSLVTDSTDGVNVVWYDLETSKWSRISFLDSSCY
jgi:hypothetical protein